MVGVSPRLYKGSSLSFSRLYSVSFWALDSCSFYFMTCPVSVTLCLILGRLAFLTGSGLVLIAMLTLLRASFLILPWLSPKTLIGFLLFNPLKLAGLLFNLSSFSAKLEFLLEFLEFLDSAVPGLKLLEIPLGDPPEIFPDGLPDNLESRLVIFLEGTTDNLESCLENFLEGATDNLEGLADILETCFDIFLEVAKDVLETCLDSAFDRLPGL